MALSFALKAQDCDFCDHYIDPKSTGQAFCTNPELKCDITWGTNIDVKAGETICLRAGTYPGYMTFYDLTGTKDNPITITNCGGQVIINTTSQGMETRNSHNFIVTGTGDPDHFYGFVIDGGSSGIDGMRLNFFSSNYEVDHVSISNVSNHGFDLKNDPLCNDPRTWRSSGNVIDYIKVHDTYVSNTGAEGFYVGDSHYQKSVPCVGGGGTTVEEQSILKAEIYNNIVENVGNDGIQVGSVIEEALLYNNEVRGFGIKDNTGVHMSGFQINPGTKAVIYDNIVVDGKGTAYYLSGDGAKVYNNLSINTKSAVEGYDGNSQLTSPGSKMEIYNNTFVDIFESGVSIQAAPASVSSNVFYNNILHIGPNAVNYGTNSDLAWKDENNKNNIFTKDKSSLNFVDPDKQDYRLTSASTLAVDLGDCSINSDISTDASGYTRSEGSACDIGAHEYTVATLKIDNTEFDFGELAEEFDVDDVSYTITGTNLRDTVKIPMPKNFLLSLDETNFEKADTLKVVYGDLRALNKKIYVKLAPQTLGEIEEDIIHISEEVESVTLKLKAEVGVLSTEDIFVENIKIYPNPLKRSTQELQIELNKAPHSTSTLVVFNSLGMKILEVDNLNKKFTINLPEQTPPGVYFVKARIDGEWDVTKKILIAN
ncbi:hypothetical protein BFP72_04040 [Reichenbachiella sp. 5M10]|nr:hypothetical protein BFP72_04040 [Reichenbachiella sp. 5M10]